MQLDDSPISLAATKHLTAFAYKFDVFSTYSNPRHFSSTDTTSAHNTISAFPTPSTFYIAPFVSLPRYQLHLSIYLITHYQVY